MTWAERAEERRHRPLTRRELQGNRLVFLWLLSFGPVGVLEHKQGWWPVLVGVTIFGLLMTVCVRYRERFRHDLLGK